MENKTETYDWKGNMVFETDDTFYSFMTAWSLQQKLFPKRWFLSKLETTINRQRQTKITSLSVCSELRASKKLYFWSFDYYHFQSRIGCIIAGLLTITVFMSVMFLMLGFPHFIWTVFYKTLLCLFYQKPRFHILLQWRSKQLEFGQTNIVKSE